MAVTKITYAADAALGVSTWDSLAAGAWATTDAIVNTSNLYVDILVGGEIPMGTTTGTLAAGESFDIYVAALYDKDDANSYTGGIGDALAAGAAETADTDFTALNLIFLTSVSVRATTPDTSLDYMWGPISIAQCFGGHLPQSVILVGHNNTGGDNLTGGVGNIVGITYTST